MICIFYTYQIVQNANDIYEFRFAPTEAAPIVAINLTHGTGTETNRFAVVTLPEKDYKPAIAYDCIYPMYFGGNDDCTVSFITNKFELKFLEGDDLPDDYFIVQFGEGPTDGGEDFDVETENIVLELRKVA